MASKASNEPSQAALLRAAQEDASVVKEATVSRVADAELLKDLEERDRLAAKSVEKAPDVVKSGRLETVVTTNETLYEDRTDAPADILAKEWVVKSETLADGTLIETLYDEVGVE